MEELENLRTRADAAFAQVAQRHPQEVACHPGCDDCCHALFDLSLVEALALALGFLELPREARRQARRRALKAAPIFDRAVEEAFALSGEDRTQALSRARVPCPLLEQGRCLLYAQRPITCRLYGVPVAVGGQARTCHLARFRTGTTYPTVDLVKVQAELNRLSGLAAANLPDLPPAQRDVARAIELAYSHAPALRALVS